ncbi:MAG: tetratricopeptide repeat protein [bacterium]
MGTIGTRGYALIAMVLLLGGCSRVNDVVVPHEKTAREQYYFAARHMRQMILSNEPERRQRQAMQEIRVFEKVQEYFPDDLVHTPLARLSVADLYANLGQNEKAAKQLAQIRSEYPDNPFVVANSLYAEGIARDTLGQYPKSQELYRECLDRFSDSDNAIIKVIVADARRRYQRVR